MPTQEFHRFRMQIDLEETFLPESQLPAAYRWQCWVPAQLERHALAKWKSFRSELDSHIFPCLGQLEGCRRLMSQIAKQRSFLPQATWLLVYQPEPIAPSEDCGIIQGVRRNRKLGAIQNVGITPHHRHIGLGRALVLQSLHGFKAAGLCSVALEVTADNRAAVGLYRSIGFQIVKRLVKSVEIADPTPA